MGTRPLPEAIEVGDLESLRWGLVDVIDMHVKADLLATAVKLGRRECIDVLLDFGADPFLKQNDSRRTALYWTVVKDDDVALRLLLRDIYRDPIEVLLESSSVLGDDRQAARERPDENATTIKMHVNGSNRTAAAGDAISYRTRRAMDEALFEAACLGSVRTTGYLLQTGANPNLFFYHDDEFLSWCTPLIAACYSPLNAFCRRDVVKAEETVRLLIERGADVGAQNYVGDTALHWAGASGLRDAVLVLLRNGADVGAQNRLGSTPVMNAIDKSCPGDVAAGDIYDTVTTLLEWGAGVNDIDNCGWSVLCYAVNSQNDTVAELLLRSGARPDYDVEPTKHDIVTTTTPLFVATTLDNRRLVTLLIRWGADVNRKAGSIVNPVSPFESCLQMSNFELALVYLAVGSDHRDAWRAVESGVRKTLGGLPETMVEYLKIADRCSLNGLERVRSVLSEPKTLKNVSRLVLRSRVATENLGTLPLPTALIAFLNFDDIC